jgi:hypothetical protein
MPLFLLLSLLLFTCDKWEYPRHRDKSLCRVLAIEAARKNREKALEWANSLISSHFAMKERGFAWFECIEWLRVSGRFSEAYFIGLLALIQYPHTPSLIFFAGHVSTSESSIITLHNNDLTYQQHRSENHR